MCFCLCASLDQNSYDNNKIVRKHRAIVQFSIAKQWGLWKIILQMKVCNIKTKACKLLNYGKNTLSINQKKINNLASIRMKPEYWFRKGSNTDFPNILHAIPDEQPSFWIS